MRINKSLLIFSTLATSALSAHAALSITLNFNNTGVTYANLHNASWGGATADATKSSAFEATVRAAADRWEYAYRNSSEVFNHSIDIEWTSHSGSTLAFATIGWDGSNDISSADITFDSSGTDFYIDTVPTDSSEWSSFSNRNLDLGGGLVNVERISYNSATSEVSSNNDLYSVALHEIGHTLGVISGYPRYTALQSGGDLNLSDSSDLPFSAGHTDITTLSDPPGLSLLGSYGPNSLSPTIVTGTRKELTAIDIQLAADIQGLTNFDTAQVPEPSSVALLGLGGLTLLTRRKRAT